ncbi:MAG: tetratricopeptide repeat protein [Planctomycetota bacterium]
MLVEQVSSEVGDIREQEETSRLSLLVALMLAVAAIVFAAHWPVLSRQALSFDDEQYLLENQLVKNPNWQSARRFLTEVLYPSTVRGYYQPLAMISLMLDYAVGGRADNLMPFRRTSLFLHAANTLLLIVLFYLLFGQVWPAAIVGLLYGVHPVTIESIPWLAERKTLLAAFFSLWCLIFYVHFSRSGSIIIYLLSMVLFVLALMSKPTSTPVPLLMLVLDYWPLKRLGRRTVLEKVPFVIIAGIAALITFLSQRNTADVIMPSEHGLIRIPLMICHNIIFYLYKFVWPFRLSAFYPFPSPFTPTHPMLLAGIIGTCILIVLLLIALRWTRALLAGWVFFFLAVFPTLGVIGFHPVIAADRHVYLPMVGFLLPLGAFLAWLGRDSDSGFVRRDILVTAAVLVVCSAEIVGVRRYLVSWRDTVTHYEYMLSLFPGQHILHNNLALALAKAEKHEQAVEHYMESLRLKPNSYEVHNNLGNALCKLGRINEAIEHYRKSVKLKSRFAVGRYNLARALAEKGNLAEAVAEFRKAVKFKPNYVEAWNEMGYALARQGRLEEAVVCYVKAIELKQDLITAHGRLGLALASLDRPDDAIAQFRIVLKARPDDFEMYFNVGFLLEKQGQIQEAISHYRRALEINPDFTKARRQLEGALAKQKDSQ